MKKGQIWALVIVVIILIIITIVIVINLQSTTTSTTSGATTTTTAGIGEIFNSILNIFKPKAKGNYCDCSRPGFAADGAADSNCNVGGLFYSQEC